MLLADIRDYLKKRGTTSLNDIAIHFDITVDSAWFALEYWMKKGKVSELGASCGSSCGDCSSGSAKNYQWREVSRVLTFMPYASG